MKNPTADIIVWAPAEGDHPEIRKALERIKDPEIQKKLQEIATANNLPALNFAAANCNICDPHSEMLIRVGADLDKINHDHEKNMNISAAIKKLLNTEADVLLTTERKAGIPGDSKEAMQLDAYRYGENETPLQKIFDNRVHQRKVSS